MAFSATLRSATPLLEGTRDVFPSANYGARATNSFKVKKQVSFPFFSLEKLQATPTPNSSVDLNKDAES